MQSLNFKYSSYFDLFYFIKLPKKKKFKKKFNLKKNSLKFFFLSVFKYCYFYKFINFEKLLKIDFILNKITILEPLKIL